MATSLRKRFAFVVASTLVVGLTLAAVGTPLASAQEDEKVAVVPFIGDQRLSQKLAEQSYNATVRALVDWFVVSPAEHVRVVVKSIGPDGTAEERFQQVAEFLGATATVEGNVTVARNVYSLELSIRSPRDGVAVETLKLAIPSRKIDIQMRLKIAEVVPEVVLKFFAKEKQRIENEEKAAEDQAKLEAMSEEEKEAILQARREAAEKKRAAELEQKNEIVRQQNELVEQENRRRLALHGSINAGITFIGRELEFIVNPFSGLTPQRFEDAPSGAATISGEVFPFGFTGKIPLANLGVRFQFQRTAASSADFQDDNFSMAQTQWGAGLNYRIPLNKSTRGTFDLMLAAGFNGLSHTGVDEDTEMPAPDVSYQYIDIGAGFKTPFWKYFTFRTMAYYLLVVSSGDIADDDAYGEATTVGQEFDARIEFLAVDLIKLSVGVHATRMALTFDEPGPLTLGGAITGGKDTFLYGYVTAGYHF